MQSNRTPAITATQRRALDFALGMVEKITEELRRELSDDAPPIRALDEAAEAISEHAAIPEEAVA